MNLAVIKPWLSAEITKILGFEDDVLVDYTYGLLETQVMRLSLSLSLPLGLSSNGPLPPLRLRTVRLTVNWQNPDPKEMQISLTGFFEAKTQELILKLWKLLLSAQESVGGIPAEFLEAKKEQLRQQQVWRRYSDV